MGEMLVLILIFLAVVALVARQVVRMVQDKGGCHHCPGCPGGKTPPPYLSMDTKTSCASCAEGMPPGSDEGSTETGATPTDGDGEERNG